ncbi:MAG: hypothetical protein HQL96_11010 [Magnetococcales bacterium]|nr:hypothetical protein [Magnetococcales bacterium]
MATNAPNRRQRERVFCGQPMEFSGCLGNALDLNEIAVFLVLAAPCAVSVGTVGVLKFQFEGRSVEEKASVARITKMGISVVSLEENSQLPHLMTMSRSGIKFCSQLAHETVVHFRGEFSAEIVKDFNNIYRHHPPGRKYRFNFQNVTSVTPSGLAMLLQLESSNRGTKEDLEIIQCNKDVMRTLMTLDAPGVNITILPQTAELDQDHTFTVTTAMGPDGREIVTIRIARIFDYNCRNEFASLYRGRPKRTQYILDFQATVHVGKAAFGTMLLLNQYSRDHGGGAIRIINCASNVKRAFESMKFDRFFEIDTSGGTP